MGDVFERTVAVAMGVASVVGSVVDTSGRGAGMERASAKGTSSYWFPGGSATGCASQLLEGGAESSMGADGVPPAFSTTSS